MGCIEIIKSSNGAINGKLKRGNRAYGMIESSNVTSGNFEAWSERS